MKKLKVGLIFGGRSGEHEVSLMSARAVLNALDRDKYEVTEIGITHDGIWLIGENLLDAFLHGKMESLIPVTLLPDPTRRGLFAIQTLPVPSPWRIRRHRLREAEEEPGCPKGVFRHRGGLTAVLACQVLHPQVGCGGPGAAEGSGEERGGRHRETLWGHGVSVR